MKIKTKWSWLVRFAENEIPMSATWNKWKPYTESEWFNELRIASDFGSWMKKREENGMEESKRERDGIENTQFNICEGEIKITMKFKLNDLHKNNIADYY